MHQRARRVLTVLVTSGVIALAWARPAPFAAIKEAAQALHAPGAPAVHAYVLDWAARTVTAVDIVGRALTVAGYGPELIPRRGPFSGSTIITFNTFQQRDDGTPAEMILSPHASRLVVLDHGPGKDTQRFGWHPSRPATVAIFGSQSLRPLAAVEAVWGLPTLHRISPDGGTLTLVGPGYQSNNAEETRPAELVNIDLRRGELTARFDLTGRVPHVTDREQWVDGTALSPDGRYLYVLDRVATSTDDRAIDAHLLVVDTRTGQTVRTLPAGIRPRGLVVDHDRGQILLLSEHATTSGRDRAGELRVIRGDELASAIEVAPIPLFLRVSPDRRQIHVFSLEGLTTIDAATMVQAGGVRIQRAGLSWSALGPVQGTRGVDDAVISPDGRRAYVVHHGSSRLSIIDLEAQRVVAGVTTGRASKKVTLLLTSLGASALSHWTAERQARAMGHDFYLYTTYFVLPATARLQVARDGRFVYVVNSQTRDITVVDTTTAKVVKHFRARGFYLQALPNSHLLAAGDETDLSFIDTRTNTTLDRLRLKGQHHAVTASPEGRQVFVLSHGELTTLDPQSGGLMTRSDYLVPTQMLFADLSLATTDEGIDASAPSPFELKTADGVLPASRWHVLHMHKASKCLGWLYVTDARIGFRTTVGESHDWEVPLDDVREVKTNRMIAGGGSFGSFHVTLREGSNYNFSLNGVPADRFVGKLKKSIYEGRSIR